MSDYLLRWPWLSRGPSRVFRFKFTVCGMVVLFNVGLLAAEAEHTHGAKSRDALPHSPSLYGYAHVRNGFDSLARYGRNGWKAATGNIC